MLLPTYLRVVTDIDDHLHVRKSVDYFEEKVLNTFTSAGAHWQYHIEGYSRSTLAVLSVGLHVHQVYYEM